MLEAIGIGIVVIIWVISSLVKGFNRLLRQTGAVQMPLPPAATPPRQSSPLGEGQFSSQPPPRTQARQPLQQGPPPSQRPPVRTPPAPPRERQPSAGGPAVFADTTRRDFERQEQDLVASEPTALNTPLISASSKTTQPNSLFGGTDDLVRAIILQEVLGPPLSRRTPKPTPPSASPQ